MKLLSEQTPASFVAFDLLALGDEDLTERPFAERRALLEQALAPRSRRSTSPRHRRPRHGPAWFDEFEGAGLDGLIAKKLDLTYQPDKRVMSKIKHERTADCVVAGYRVHKSGAGRDRLAAARPVRRPRRAGLGRGDRRVPDGHPQGAVRRAAAAGHHVRRAPVELGRARGGRAHAAQERGEPLERRQGPVVRPAAAGAGRRGALRLHGGRRFRHTAQFVRWRPDREPESCTYEQLERPVRFDLADVLGLR